MQQNVNDSSSFLYIAFLSAVIATAGSLFFSEIMELPPCVLCWYQRIAMYPLVLTLAVTIVRKDRAEMVYGFPLAFIGMCIAAYHNLLYYKVIPESIIPCTSGVSCTSRQIEWLGFITIPFLSLIGFVIIVACLLITNRKRKKL